MQIINLSLCFICKDANCFVHCNVNKGMSQKHHIIQKNKWINNGRNCCPLKKTISLEISSFAALNSQVFCSIWQQTLRWFRLRQLPITHFDMDLDNNSQKWQYNVNIWTLTYILIKYWHFKFVLIFVSAWWLNFLTVALCSVTVFYLHLPYEKRDIFLANYII